MASLIFTDNSNSWHNGGDYPNTTLTKVSWDSAPDTAIAWIFFGHVNIDFDGSPTAYGPASMSPDDDLSDAGLPLPNKPDPAAHWYGLYALKPTDPLVTAGTVKIDTNPKLNLQGKFPVIQQAENGDPNPGYYVSTLPNASGVPYLQNSYIDASKIAFGALASGFQALGVSLGDYGLAIRHNDNRQSGFYFIDTGYGNKLGECSHKVGLNLGGSGRGNRFNNNFPVSFIVFPESFTIDPKEPTVWIDDAKLKEAIQPLLANLSSADNAGDLALLMGFNELPPGANKPQGTSNLKAYRGSQGAQPKNIANILQGLQNFGFTATIAEGDAPSDSDSLQDAVATSDPSDGANGKIASDSDTRTEENNSSPAVASASGSDDTGNARDVENADRSADADPEFPGITGS